MFSIDMIMSGDVELSEYVDILEAIHERLHTELDDLSPLVYKLGILGHLFDTKEMLERYNDKGV